MDTRAFYGMVRERLSGLGIEESKRVTAVVLRALRDRLTRDEAEQIAAQLPRPLKEVWTLGDRPGRRPLKIRRDEFLQRVALGVDIPESDYPKLATLEGCVEHLTSLAGTPPNKERVR